MFNVQCSMFNAEVCRVGDLRIQDEVEWLRLMRATHG